MTRNSCIYILFLLFSPFYFSLIIHVFQFTSFIRLSSFPLSSRSSFIAFSLNIFSCSFLLSFLSISFLRIINFVLSISPLIFIFLSTFLYFPFFIFSSFIYLLILFLFLSSDYFPDFSSNCLPLLFSSSDHILSSFSFFIFSPPYLLIPLTLISLSFSSSLKISPHFLLLYL